MSKTDRTVEHGWSLLCSGASLDKDTNNLTLFNLIEEIRVVKNKLKTIPVNGVPKPLIPIIFELVTVWRKLKKDKNLKADVVVEYLDPTGKMLQKGNYVLEMPEKIERNRTRMAWAGLRITTPGTYTFRISLREPGEKAFEKVAEVPLQIFSDK